jgi:hypothetical protein
MRSKPDIFIIESLDWCDETHRKEGEIISRTLKLSGKKPVYYYVRTQRELESVLNFFETSEYRYLHFSCHGGEYSLGTTLDHIHSEKFSDIVAPYLHEKRLFLSTCLAATKTLAGHLFKKSRCFSVVGPASKISFDDSAIFWTCFYHMMFKEDPNKMTKYRIKANINKSARIVKQRIRFFSPDRTRAPVLTILPSRRYDAK